MDGEARDDDLLGDAVKLGVLAEVVTPEALATEVSKSEALAERASTSFARGAYEKSAQRRAFDASTPGTWDVSMTDPRVVECGDRTIARFESPFDAAWVVEARHAAGRT